MTDPAMTEREWIERFARAIGAEPPTPSEAEAILALAATAAHASERRAAPVACWIAARSGRSLEDVRALAEGVAGE